MIHSNLDIREINRTYLTECAELLKRARSKRKRGANGDFTQIRRRLELLCDDVHPGMVALNSERVVAFALGRTEPHADGTEYTLLEMCIHPTMSPTASARHWCAGWWRGLPRQGLSVYRRWRRQAMAAQRLARRAVSPRNGKWSCWPGESAEGRACEDKGLRAETRFGIVFSSRPPGHSLLYRQRGRMFARRLLWIFARSLIRVTCLLAFRVRVFGQHNVPRAGGVLVVSNHQSFLDPPLVGIGLHRSVAYMARRTLFRNRAFGWLLTKLNSFPVTRGGQDVDAMREAVARLKAGWCMMVFPEGTRSSDGRMGALKSGVYAMAERAGVPVIPAAVEGAFEAWPRNGWPKPHPIQVQYGRPIRVTEFVEHEPR